MNESDLRQLLSRFESQVALSEAESSELKRRLEERPELIGEILDRRAVDGMLQLLAVDEANEEQFIERCVERLCGQLVPSSTKSLSREHETSNQDVAFATVAQLARQTNLPGRRGRKWNAIPGWLILAASIVVLLGAWAGFSWWINNDSNQENVTQAKSPTVNPQPNTDTIPPAIPNDSLTEFSNTETDPVLLITEPDENEQVKVAPESKDDLWAGSNKPQSDDEPEVENNRVAESTQIRNPDSDSTIAQKSERPTIATLEHTTDALWDGENPANEIGAGNFGLLSGSVSLKLKNGVLIRMLGPSDFELNTADSVRFESGNFIAEIPQTVNQFVIATQFGTLQNPVNARVQLIVDPVQGIEALVTRGQISLFHSNSGEYQDRIELSKNGLFQSIVRPILDRPTISGLMMARGKDEFKGQIGLGTDSVKLESPVIFANVLSRVTEQPKTNAPIEDFSKNWLQFAREFQAFSGNVDSPEFRNLINNFLGENNLGNPAEKIGDVLGNGTTNFQGSLSINGVEKKFNSREEYEKARLQLLNGSLLQGLPNNPGQSNAASDFKGVISVNGKTLEFSSPDKFKALRKQMTR